jgi:hypothetical protein
MSRLGAGILTGGGVPGNDAFTKILLHMDGANGGTTFTDDNAGGVSATWSTSGSPTTTTTSPRFGTASYQGNSSSHIVSNQVAAYQAGSSDFTVDFWMRGTDATTLQYICGFLDGSQTTFSAGWYIYYDASKFLRGTFGNTSASSFQTNTGATTVLDGNWHHIALVKTSSSVQIYIDGVATGSPVTPSGSMYSSSGQRLWIGSAPIAFGSTAFRGQIDEFRYSLGIARWNANFTPPTGPYN